MVKPEIVKYMCDCDDKSQLRVGTICYLKLETIS